MKNGRRKCQWAWRNKQIINKIFLFLGKDQEKRNSKEGKGLCSHCPASAKPEETVATMSSDAEERPPSPDGLGWGGQGGCPDFPKKETLLFQVMKLKKPTSTSFCAQPSFMNEGKPSSFLGEGKVKRICCKEIYSPHEFFSKIISKEKK